MWFNNAVHRLFRLWPAWELFLHAFPGLTLPHAFLWCVNLIEELFQLRLCLGVHFGLFSQHLVLKNDWFQPYGRSLCWDIDRTWCGPWKDHRLNALRLEQVSDRARVNNQVLRIGGRLAAAEFWWVNSMLVYYNLEGQLLFRTQVDASWRQSLIVHFPRCLRLLL